MMSLDAAILTAVVEALHSPEAREALRHALEGLGGEPQDDDRAYTVAEVAELSGYGTAAILERISSCDLPAHKPKGCREWRIRRQDYRAWLTNCGDDVDEEPGELDPDEVARKMLKRQP